MSFVSRIIPSALLVTALLAVGGCASNQDGIAVGGSGAASETPSAPVAPSSEAPTPDPVVTPTPTPTPEGFDKTKKSIDNPASSWVVVNKLRPLDPADYAADDLVSVPVPYQNPPILRKRASDAVVEMFDAFTDETGLEMQSQSAYRSYSAQVRVYNGWVSSLGKKAADLTSARPGFSEHQTGLAIDINAKPTECTLKACFGDTKQGKWLAKNAWEYGFILRYPEDATDITGYEYEPWHYRFVGLDLAEEMHDTGTETLEEFFDLPAAPDYK